MKTEWVHKKLGDDDVAKIIMGQSPSSASYNDENIGLPFLQGCADFGEVFPKTSVYCNEPLKVAPQNSILMSVRAPVGTINKADQKYIIGRGLCSIVSLINNDYLYYYLLQNKNRLEQKAQGSTFLAINSAEVNDFDVSYPESLSTQRRIAAILNSADKVIAATQKTIAKYKQIKQGMMEDLLNEQCTMNNVQWKKVKLGEVGKISMCKRVFSFETSTESEIPFYKIGTFGKDADAFISRQLYEEYKSKFSYPKVGDILISASGTIGRTVVYDGEPAYFQDSNIIWIDNNETIVLNQFLYYQYQIISWNLEGSTIARLYNDNFNRIEITIPDLAEQRRIAAILSGIDAKIAAEEKVLQKYEKVKKGLMERLLNEQCTMNN